jgi:hypothetical protein
MLTEKSKPNFGFLPFSPRTLISLADMIEFFAAGIAHNWQWLIGESHRFYQKAVESPSGKPTPHEIHNLKALLKTHNAPIEINGKIESTRGWLFYCEQLGMEKSKASIEHFFIILNTSNSIPNFSVIDSQLRAIHNCLWFELFERKFAFIPTSKAQLFEQKKLFGDDVWDAFPEARDEIRDAGNCLAADLNTAAVFHLMRVMELGLRQLSFQLKAKALIKRLKQTKIPIELGTWDEVITTLESKLDDLRKRTTRSPKREQKIETCNELLKEFRSVKDLWRNKVMHARATYDEEQAQSAFNHVRAFMQKLAEKF